MNALAASQLQAALVRIDAVRIRLSTPTEATANSLASLDAEVPHARYVTIFARTALAVALDHLTAWQLIVRGGVIPIYSPLTLLRGSLEGAVICRWLVDPRVDPMSRVARGVAAQVHDWDERRKFEVSIDAPEPPEGGPAESGASRLSDVLAARDLAGIPVVPYPAMTALMTLFGTPGYSSTVWVYRLASAFAHATQWALLGTQMGPTSDGQMPGVVHGVVSANDTVTVGTTLLAIEHLETALAEYGAYVGS